MKRGDQVLIKRGGWKNTQGMVTKIIDPGFGGSARVEIAPCGTPGDEPYDRINLAIASVTPVAER